MKIFIVTHKKFEQPKEKGYIPMQVGMGKDLFDQRDNLFDNISEKNESFCELTAAYWIWKNVKEDIVGIVHYRRYFFKTSWNASFENLLDEKSIRKILKKYDIIVPNVLHIYSNTLYEHYAKNYHIEDYNNCRKIIKNEYPEYLESFDYVSKKHNLVPCNMMIARKEIFDEYYSWVFDILFKLEKITDISSYDVYNKRIYGFISERLFTVWLYKNSKYKIKKYPVINIENKKYVKSYLMNMARGLVLKIRDII